MPNHANNYYILRRVARWLNNSLTDAYLLRCFSASKQEVAFHFERDGELAGFRVWLGEESFVFPDSSPESVPSRAKYPFRELEGKKVLKVESRRQDRCLVILFEDGWQLILALYGRNANIFLFQGDELVSLYRPNIERDKAKTPADFGLAGPESAEELEAVLTANSAGSALKQYFPALANLFPVSTLPSGSSQELWDAIRQREAILENSILYVTDTGVFKAGIPGIQVQLTNPEVGVNILWEGDEIGEALREYARFYFRRLHTEGLRLRLLSELQARLKRTEAQSAAAEQRLQALDEEKSYRLLADLLMANLHNIPSGSESVELENFYTGQPVRIKLNSRISPQAQAEKLYHKAKNQEQERTILWDTLEDNEIEIKELKEQIEIVSSAQSLKELKAFVKETKSETPEASPFRRFLYEGYEILVGKNAAVNDRLTTKFAHKEDLWLHARGVTGSHVIIRHKKKGIFPQPVIEKAARIAAWYSRARGSGLVPVAYALKKFVRKPKGAALGAVVMDREDVIMAEPGLGE